MPTRSPEPDSAQTPTPSPGISNAPGSLSRSTRAVVAAALAEKAEQVHQAVRLLCDSAAAGDLKSAQALIPWLNQALGMPTERVERRKPSSLEELEQMNTAELEAIVAE